MKLFTKWLIFAITYFCITNICIGQNNLIQKSNFIGTPRVSASSCTIGNYGYLIGGYDSVGAKNDFWRYNSTNDTWKKLEDFPGLPRYGAVCLSIGRKIYYGTGLRLGNSFGNDFWEFDIDSNKWTQKQNFPGLGRAYAVAFNVKNKIFIGTGTNSSVYFSDLYEFNIDSNKWTQKASLPAGKRSSSFSFSMNNKGYLGAGSNGTNSFNDFWEFETDSNKWAQKANIGTTGRWGSIAFNIDSTPYIAFGSGDGFKNQLLSYNNIINNWNLLSDFKNINRIGPITFSFGKKVYFGTGTDSAFALLYNDFWEYSPSSAGISNLLSETNFMKIVPNPNNGSFKLFSINEKSKTFEIEILNEIGELVWKINSTEFFNDCITIETEGLKTGIFYLKISGPQFFQVQKLLISK